MKLEVVGAGSKGAGVDGCGWVCVGVGIEVWVLKEKLCIPLSLFPSPWGTKV